jgi:hypothetical protein
MYHAEDGKCQVALLSGSSLPTDAAFHGLFPVGLRRVGVELSSLDAPGQWL